MPFESVQINERAPPVEVIIDAKRMDAVPNAVTTEVAPSDGGKWSVEVTGDEVDGAPFDVQQFIQRVRDASEAGPLGFTPDAANNRITAEYDDPRFE